MKALLISDTHCAHDEIELPEEDYDIVLCTGDFSNSGSEDEADAFLEWFSCLPCEHKVLIAGNHDWYPFKHDNEFKSKCSILGVTYLNESSVTINGIKIYGCPWVPRFYDWAFMENEKQLQKRWNKIPEDTDILLTHSPALWKGDICDNGHVGSETLSVHLKTLPNIKLHVFGHIHECAGYDVVDGNLRSVNASVMGEWYSAVTPKIIKIGN